MSRLRRKVCRGRRRRIIMLKGKRKILSKNRRRRSIMRKRRKTIRRRRGRRLNNGECSVHLPRSISPLRRSGLPTSHSNMVQSRSPSRLKYIFRNIQSINIGWLCNNYHLWRLCAVPKHVLGKLVLFRIFLAKSH